MADSDDDVSNGKKKDIWDKVRASGTALVALVVGVLGYWINSLQTELDRVSGESQFYTQLMAERERADSDLRAQMFQTLFDAYFKERLGKSSPVSKNGPGESTPDQSESTATASEERSIDQNHQEIILLDMLARNFETIDIRPLLEELDHRLTENIRHYKAETNPADASQEQKDLNELARASFREREQLRRAARGNVARQAAALLGLPGAKSSRWYISSNCGREPGDNAELGAKVSLLEGDEDVLVEPHHLEDGRATVVVVPLVETPGIRMPYQDPFTVTFFDMPNIENFSLPSGMRLAVILEKYVSPDEYASFVDLLSRSLRDDHEAYLADEKMRSCREAYLRVVQFPEGYLGLRDRPFIEKLIKRTFHEPDTAGFFDGWF